MNKRKTKEINMNNFSTLKKLFILSAIMSVTVAFFIAISVMFTAYCFLVIDITLAIVKWLNLPIGQFLRF